MAGEHFDFQQLALWARRFDLEHEITAPPGYYSALPIVEGYKQLAYLMAQMMAFRDDVLLADRDWTAETARQAQQFARTADKLGIRAEAWKLNYLLFRRTHGRRKRVFRKRFCRHFLQCEYSVSMRLWQAVANN